MAEPPTPRRRTRRWTTTPELRQRVTAVRDGTVTNIVAHATGTTITLASAPTPPMSGTQEVDVALESRDIERVRAAEVATRKRIADLDEELTRTRELGLQFDAWLAELEAQAKD